MGDVTSKRAGPGVRRARVTATGQERATAMRHEEAREALTEQKPLPDDAPEWAKRLAARVDALATLLGV